MQSLDGLGSQEVGYSFDFAKIRSRDPGELTRLFTSLNPRLLRFVASKGLFLDSAEELVHECWEVFFSSIDRFEGRSTVQTFLMGIAVNKVREHRRRMSRYDFEEDAESVFNRSFTTGGWWAQEPSDPERMMSNLSLGQQIVECLEGLTDAQRHAFVLIESEGSPPESVCHILDVKITHLRVLLFRAKSKLRACLEGTMTS